MNVEALCRLLPWDTDFFGRRIGRLLPERITQEQIEAALAWSRENRLDCLYYLADPDDRLSLSLAEEHGFHLVDVRVTLEGHFSTRDSIPATNGNVRVRPHQPEDVAGLEAIAAGIYTTTRFYFDPKFEALDASRLYRTWVRKSCSASADRVFVAEDELGLVGFVTCVSGPGESCGSVGLFGVAPRGRGQGVGGALVRAALEWFVDHGLEHIRVVTQARNIPAQALYQRMGFTTQQVRLWYHRWFEPRGDSSVTGG